MPGLTDSILGQLSAVRKVSLAVTIAGQDVSSVLTPSLISLSYHEAVKEHAIADSMELLVADPEARFRLVSSPQTYQTIALTISVSNWAGPGTGTIQKDCGVMYISEIRFRGDKSAGTTVSISCTSIDPTTSFRLEQQSKGWNQTTAQGVAGQIAADNGWVLKYLPASNPVSERIDQHDHSSSFALAKLCSENDFVYKIINQTLWLRSYPEIEQQAPIATIVCPSPTAIGGLNGSGITSWEIRQATEDVYGSATVAVKDNTSGQTVIQTIADPNAKQPTPRLHYHRDIHGNVTDDFDRFA
jgi:phage protein D